MLLITNPTYEVLKRVVQVILPALSAFYFGLAQIWGLPYGEEVMGTLALIATFLGICLGISSNTYKNSELAYDGSMVVTSVANGVKTFSLELDVDPDDLERKESITFKVKPAFPSDEPVE